VGRTKERAMMVLRPAAMMGWLSCVMGGGEKV